MNYGIIFWAIVVILSMSEGMRTWTYFDKTCARVHTKYITNKWHLEYLVEEEKIKQLKKQWEDFKY